MRLNYVGESVGGILNPRYCIGVRFVSDNAFIAKQFNICKLYKYVEFAIHTNTESQYSTPDTTT